MSANYWRNRWISALVHSGIEPHKAADLFEQTYRDHEADFSKSPEVQALMSVPLPKVSGPRAAAAK